MKSEAIKEIERKKAAIHILTDAWAHKLESYAKQHATWIDRTGHARQAIHSGVDQSGDDTTLYLSHGVQYGVMLEEGTKPHIIKPVNKKALYWPGAPHPVKQVKHPGTKGNPVIGPTIKRNMPQIRKDIRSLLRG